MVTQSRNNADCPDRDPSPSGSDPESARLLGPGAPTGEHNEVVSQPGQQLD